MYSFWNKILRKSYKLVMIANDWKIHTEICIHKIICKVIFFVK